MLQGGGKDTVFISSNTTWNLYDIPDWVCIQNKNGKGDAFLEIAVLPNKTNSERDANIGIINGEVSESMSIHQLCETTIGQLAWYTFPTGNLDSVKYTLAANGIERIYKFYCREMFINKYIKDKIFHGNLINKTLNSAHELTSYPQYTYNQITMGSFTGGKSFIKTAIPSLSGTETFANEIAETLPVQSQYFYNASPIKYTSYRQLNLLGRGNIGISLEELISGHPYKEKEMEHKTGLIYSYNMVLISIMMDHPPKLIEENMNDENLLGSLAYISNVNYGKTAYLLVETNENEEVMKSIVGKVTASAALNAREQQIIEEADIYYLHFNPQKEISVERGHMDMIKKYKNSISGTSVIPLTFSVLNYTTHSVGNMNYQLNLP